MFTALFYIIIIIIAVDFLLERYLECLNIRHSAGKLPDLLKDIFDDEKYGHQQAYLKENYRFGIWTSGFNFVILMLMLLFSGFSWVNNLTASLSSNPVWWALAFLGIIMLTADLLNLPFSIYDTFVIEQKYGFNKTTAKTFILDKLKSLFLAALIGGGLLALIIRIYEKTGNLFWILAWGLVTLFSLFMAMFYSNLIVPIFNRQTPLPEGELRSAIREFARKVGFRLDNVFIINGSKRSSKGNAYFTGLGPKKRIVLYDTLIDEMTVNEMIAVLAHEIGHYKKKHVLVGLIIGLIQTGILLFLFSVFVKSPALSQALGVQQPNFHIGMITFGILYSPVSIVIGLLGNLLSRSYEYQADRFACEHSDPAALVTALKKLSLQNLSNLTPHPLYVFFHYSHPPLYERLKNIQKFLLHES